MQEPQHTLDSDYINDDKENGIDRQWAILVIIVCGIKLVYTAFVFIGAWELPEDVYTFVDLLYTVIYLYLLWFIKEVCNRYFGITSVNLPVFLLFGLALLEDAIYMYSKYVEELTWNTPLSPNKWGLNLARVACLAWLLVLLFRLPSYPLKKYLRLWSLVVVFKSFFPFLFYLAVGFLHLPYTDMRTHINDFLFLLPDLVLMYMVLKEPVFGVIESKGNGG